jgi:hypothetical protein
MKQKTVHFLNPRRLLSNKQVQASPLAIKKLIDFNPPLKSNQSIYNNPCKIECTVMVQVAGGSKPVDSHKV